MQVEGLTEDDEVSVFVSTAYEPVVDVLWCTINSKIGISPSLLEITLSFALDMPEELYNISVVYEENDEMISIVEPRAVQVVNTMTDSFSFIHVSDFHVGDFRGFAESIKETIGWKSVKRCIEEINLLHPDFVIISGDLVYGQLYPFEYAIEYKTCYDLIQLFDVPTFLVPGNHDGYNRILEDGLSVWESYFGSPYYSFDYGSAHFQAINSFDMNKWYRLTFLMIPLNWGGSISDEQLQWISNDLEEHQDSSLIVQFMHHNPLWDTQEDSLMSKPYANRDSLLSLIDSYDVDLVCAGHVHYDSVNTQNDTLFITTTTPESEIRVDDGYWGYRLIKIIDGSVFSYNYKPPKYSIPSYHLSVNQSYLQNGATAEITNDLEMPVDVLVKFDLPLDDYKVNLGDIVLERHKDEEMEIYVQASIPSLEKAIILVSKE
jgi:Icc-related predicted phosphoesterase